MQFEKFIAQLADRLPFGVSFNVSPDENAIDTYEVIPGMELNRYNDLTVAETWFGNIVQELNNKKSAEVQIELKLLAAKLKDTIPSIKSIAHSLGLLFKPVDFLAEIKEQLNAAQADIDAEKNPVMKKILSEATQDTQDMYDMYREVLDSEAYSNFFINNTESYQKIADLTKLVENDLSIKWVIVTFFLMSRFDGDWSFDRTARLPMSVIDKVYEFYKKEANKGLDTIDIEVPDEEIAAPDKDEKTGKVLTEEEKEAFVLGKN